MAEILLIGLKSSNIEKIMKYFDQENEDIKTNEGIIFSKTVDERILTNDFGEFYNTDFN